MKFLVLLIALSDNCLEEKKVGKCRAAVKRFYYNPTSAQCELFIFGGCAFEANGNNFLSKDECDTICAKPIAAQKNNKTQEVKPDVKHDDCYLEKQVGPCFGAFDRFFFNPKTKKCEAFIYGGCQGNKNNFHKRDECEKLCLNVKDDKSKEKEKEKPVEKEKEKPVEKDKNAVKGHICSEEKKTGNCRAFFKRFYFNSTAKQCQEFVYGGCDGNKNNFISKVSCERECAEFLKDKPVTPVKEDKDKVEKPLAPKCSMEKKTGSCRANIERFYFDAQTKKCGKFVYGGCDGNENNFRTLADCERECAGVKPTLPAAKATSKSPVNPCVLPSDTGMCRAFMERFFYNTKTKKCEKFVYGGCQGNENNFRTIEECNKKCSK